MQRPKKFVFAILLVLVFGSARPYLASAQEFGLAQQIPVVHAVMFWMEGCSNCQYVLDELLPPLQQQYKDQLDILFVELKSTEDVDQLYQTANALGIENKDVGVPFLIIGETVLIGSSQISAKLPELIEKHLAEGGVSLPDFTRLIENPPSASPELQEPSDGFWLAYIVIIFMVASLLFAGIAFVRGKTTVPRHFSMRWIDLAIPVLCLIGLGVAGYLAYVETQAVSAVCGPVGDCNAVQSSPYARLFGILPIGVLGLAGYMAILAAWLYHRFKRNRMSSYMPVIFFGFTTFCVLFSLYLTVLEPFVIHAVCIWCITSAVIMTLLLLLSIQPALQTIENLQQADHPHANDEIETTSQ